MNNKSLNSIAGSQHQKKKWMRMKLWFLPRLNSCLILFLEYLTHLLWSKLPQDQKHEAEGDMSDRIQFHSRTTFWLKRFSHPNRNSSSLAQSFPRSCYVQLTQTNCRSTFDFMKKFEYLYEICYLVLRMTSHWALPAYMYLLCILSNRSVYFCL